MKQRMFINEQVCVDDFDKTFFRVAFDEAADACGHLTDVGEWVTAMADVLDMSFGL